MYDFYLITIVVVDEFGEGIPVGWAISNREDGCILTQFFKNIIGIHGQPYTETQKLNNYFVNGTLIEHGEKDLLNTCGNKKIE